MRERARHSMRISLYLVGILIICAPLLFCVWPVFALYGYAPFIFSTSPSLGNNKFLGKISAIELECHKTWIWGYYATDTAWEDVLVFYRAYGYQPSSPNNDYVSLREQQLVRQVSLFDRRAVGEIRDEKLRNNLSDAFSKDLTVYSFSLSYTENEEAFQHSSCRGD